MIELAPDERADIALVKVVDAYWRATNQKAWWNGADELTKPDQDGFEHPLIHFPDFQNQLGNNLLAQGFSRGETIANLARWGVQSDYVAGEYVHKSLLTSSGAMRVVPTALNVLSERYFGAFKRLFGYQLAFWYAPPRHKIIINVGGRGSGKTLGASAVMLLHLALNPGEDWLHVALIEDQANELYEKAIDMAFKTSYLSNGDPCPRTFSDTFFWKGGNPTVTSPYARIIFEPWDSDDAGLDKNGKAMGGNTLHVRALKDKTSAEKRRGKTVGMMSGDELFREVDDWKTVSTVADAVRGPNEYKLAKLTPELKRKYLELTRRIRIAEERGDQKISDALSEERASFGIEKTGRVILIGNSGATEWPAEFEEEYEDNPETARALFIRASMYDNPNLTAEDRRGYEERWADNPEERDVELMGNRPVGLGGEIDPVILRTAIKIPLDVGVIMRNHRSYGVQHWICQPNPDRYYMTVGDIGLDRAPRRNAPCIMTWEFNPDIGGMDLVYFWWGWERRKTYSWFLDQYKYCMDTYPVLDPTYWVYDAGGTQAGTFEVFRSYMGQSSGRDDYFGYPMRLMNVQKETGKKLVIQGLQNGWIRWPEIKALIAQPSNWNMEMDRDDKPQDVTMTLFMSVIRAWPLLNDPSLLQSAIDEQPANWYDPYQPVGDIPVGSKPLISGYAPK